MVRRDSPGDEWGSPRSDSENGENDAQGEGHGDVVTISQVAEPLEPDSDGTPSRSSRSSSRRQVLPMMASVDWGRRRVAGMIVGLTGTLLLTLALSTTDTPGTYRPAAWYLVMVALAALVGGVGALAVTLVACVIGIWYTLVSPVHTFAPLGGDDLWGMAGFIVAAGAIGLLITRMEAALRERDLAVQARLKVEADARARAELDATRAELYVSELQRLRASRIVDALQEAMLPQELPAVDGFELDASYTPATPDLAVGGDWFDAFRLDDRTLALAVGDVSGHGLSAAALMAQLRNAKRAFIFEDPAPGHVLGRLNHYLYRLESADFATVLYGLLDLTSGDFRWAVAGHPPPIFFRPGAAAPVEDPSARGPLLGFRSDAVYGETVRTLEPAGGVLLYSDGLVERRDGHLDDGIAVVADLLADAAGDDPVDGMCERLVSRLDGGHEGRDDVCQLLVRRTAAA